MNYTDEQLKRALARMLPDILLFNEAFQILVWDSKDKPLERDILDTELLHLCWMVEETLSDKVKRDEWSEYCIELNRTCCSIGCGPNKLCGFTIHATWQQRTIALAKVKGVEL